MALALRDDFDAARLRRYARRSGNADQVRRLLALAAIYDGASRAEAAEIGGVTRQIVRDWVVRFNEGGPEALVTRKALGATWHPTQRPEDQRTASTYIFGAICPTEGKAAGLVLPWCNTEAMNLHLVEISARITPGRHAVLVVDQAGWHLSERLVVPVNITIVPLPAKCPELNRQENVWQFLRENWLSNRVFTSYDNIVDHC